MINDAKFSGYYFYMRPNTYRDFQTGITVSLSETYQLSMSQRSFNWYLNETDVFEMPLRRTAWHLWLSPLISGHFDMSF